MNPILTKIADIEATASAILEEAAQKKAAYAGTMKQKADDFDRNTDIRTKDILEKKRAEFNAQTEADVKALEEQTKKHIANLRESYREHHAAYVKQIIINMTKE